MNKYDLFDKYATSLNKKPSRCAYLLMFVNFKLPLAGLCASFNERGHLI